MIQSGFIYGTLSALGAAARAAYGYKVKVQEDSQVSFDLFAFGSEVLPAALVGFVMGAMVENLPEITSVDGVVMGINMMLGGAGAGSVVSKFKK